MRHGPLSRKRTVVYFAAFIAAGCGAEKGRPPAPPPPPPPGDTTPPTVLAAFPADGATGVALEVRPSITLSEPAAAGALAAALRLDVGGVRVAGSVEVSGEAATFVPSAPLAYATFYQATLEPVEDLAQNRMAQAHRWSFTTRGAPNVPPRVVSTVPEQGARIRALPTLDLVFSEPVSGAGAAASYVLSGPGAGTLAPTGAALAAENTWRVAFSGAPADGALVVQIAGVADADGATLENGQVELVADTTAPTLAALPAPGAVLSALPRLDLTFSEPVLGADAASSYTLAGAGLGSLAVSAVQPLGGDSYRVLFGGNLTDGPFSVTVGGVTDLAGNPLAGGALAYTGDVQQPTVTADPASGSLLSSLPRIALTFSEAVTGADAASSYSLSGAGLGTLAVTAVVGLGSNSYRLDTTGAPGNGAVVVAISGVADLAQNPLAVLSRTLLYNLDVAPPTAALVQPPSGSRLRGDTAISVRFSETLARSSLVLGGTLRTASDGGAFSKGSENDDTLTFRPTSAWPEGAGQTLIVDVSDRAGNPLTQLTLTYLVDATAPSATASPPSGAAITASRQIVVTFLETMDRASLSLGQSLSGAAAAPVWSISSTLDDRVTIGPSSAWPAGPGALTVDAADLAGNPLPTLSLSYTVDASLPTASAQPAGGPIRGSTAITITFDESMAPGTLTLGGDMATESAGGAFSKGSADDDTLTIRPAAAWTEGAGRTLTVEAQDLAGNALPPLDLTFTVDATVPTATASPASGARIRAGQEVAVQFSEPMSTSGVVLAGALLTESDGGSWSAAGDRVVLRPATAWSGGAKGLTVSGADLAGNPLSALALSYTVDPKPPTATVSPASGTRIGPETVVRILFDEEVDPDTLVLGGGLGPESDQGEFSSTLYANDTLEVSALSGSWSVGEDQTLTVDVSDLAGNPLATLVVTYDVDALVPTATVSPPSGAVIGSARAITVTFSKSMDILSLALTGTFAGEDDGGVWSGDDELTISPATAWSSGPGSLTVNVRDPGGNLLTLELSYTVDTKEPTAAAAPPSGYVNDGARAIVITFSEGMATGSLSLGGSMAGEADAGSWSSAEFPNDRLTVRPLSRWTEGAGDLTVDARDLVGNALPTLTLAYTVDTVRPTILSLSPAPGYLTSASTPIVATFSETMDTGSLQVSGTLAAEADAASWSSGTQVTFRPRTVWSEGTKILEVDARDLAQNPLPHQSATYRVDTVLPTASASPASGARIGTGRAIEITFSEPMQPAALVLGGTLGDAATAVWSAGNQKATLSPRTAWSEGTDPLTVSARDLAGLEVVLDLSYVVDGSPPTAEAAPLSGARIQPSRAIVITFSESMAPGTLSLSGSMSLQDDGATWSSSAFPDDRLTIEPQSSWSETTHGLTVSAQDLAGNAVSLTLSYTVDGTAPTATIDPSGGFLTSKTQPIAISFSESMDRATLELGGSLAGQVSGAAWTSSGTVDNRLTLTSDAWSEGAGTLIVDAKDLAGNALARLTLSYTVDIIAPSLVSVSPPDGSYQKSRSFSVVLLFSETMKTASKTLGGSMVSNGGSWDSVSFPTDKLTLAPLSTWSEGAQTLAVSATDLAGNSFSQILSYTIDATRPTVLSISPPSGSLITDASSATTLSVVFSETMDPSTLSGGTPSFSPAGATWSTFTRTNDKVTFRPAGRWPEGDLELGFEVADLAGNYADGASARYDVLDQVVYVRAGSADTSPGTRTKPKGSVQVGIDTAHLYYPAAWVAVAEGTYAAGTGIQLASGIALYGGLGSDFDFSDFDAASHVTRILDSRSSGGAPDNPVAAVSALDVTGVEIYGFDVDGPSGVYAAGVFTRNAGGRIYGNVIHGSQGTSSYGILSVVNEEGSSEELNIYQNEIRGGSGATSAGLEYHLWASTGEPILYVMANHIDGGSGASSLGAVILSAAAPQRLLEYLLYNRISAGSGTALSVGVDLTTAEAILYANTIFGGGASTGSYGIYSRSGGPLIIGNSIHGGSSASASGVAVGGDASNQVFSYPYLANNIIQAPGAAGRCVHELNDWGNPSPLENNDLAPCGQAAYYDFGGQCGAAQDNTCTVAEMEALQDFPQIFQGGVPKDNIGIDPGLVDPAGGDWSFGASPPCAVTQGGQDFSSWGLDTDLDGNPRTVPWSIGALDQDTCVP